MIIMSASIDCVLALPISNGEKEEWMGYEFEDFHGVLHGSDMVADIQELPSEVDTPTLLHHNNNIALNVRRHRKTRENLSINKVTIARTP